MSKRFGRNQKRKLKAAFEQMVMLAAQKNRDLQEEQRRCTTLDKRVVEWARAIHSQLGPEHPFNERITEMLVRSLPDARYLERRTRVPVDALDHADIAATFIDIVVHVASVTPERFRDSYRAVLKTHDGVAAYLIDKRELKQGRGDPRFIEWLGRSIAEKLARYASEERLRW